MNLRWVAGEDGDVVAAGEEAADELLTDEAATARDDDSVHPPIVLPKKLPRLSEGGASRALWSLPMQNLAGTLHRAAYR